MALVRVSQVGTLSQQQTLLVCPNLGHRRKETYNMQNEYIEYVLKKGKVVITTSCNYETVKKLQFLRGGEVTKVRVMDK